MVLIYAEKENDSPKKITYEILTKGKELADSLGEKLEVVTYGSGDALKGHADKVYCIEEEYNLLSTKRHLSELVKGHSIVLYPATEDSIEIAGRTAVRLETGLVSGVSDLYMEGDALYAVKPVFNGKLDSIFKFEKKPYTAVVLPGSFKPSEGGYDAEIVNITTTMAKQIETLERKLEASDVNLKDAKVLVVAGRGIRGDDNGVKGLELIKEFAQTIGAEVGASKAAIDLGIIEESRQIGQTGEQVSPDVIIEVGVSGAMQHIAGMKNSKTIISINKDETAPIFDVSHYGVVGDLFKVLPKLIEKYK